MLKGSDGELVKTGYGAFGRLRVVGGFDRAVEIAVCIKRGHFQLNNFRGIIAMSWKA